MAADDDHDYVFTLPDGRQIKGVVTGYRLVIQSAGLGFSDKTEIKDEDPLQLLPKYIVDDSGVRWAHYGDEDDFIELREEFIWSRSLNPIIEPDPTELANLTEEERNEAFRPPEASDLRRELQGEM